MTLKSAVTAALLAAAAGLVLSRCAGHIAIDPITLSADTAAIVGEHAVETNKQYVIVCASHLIEATRCERWARWFRAFQGQYSVAHDAFEQATAAGDLRSARDAAARIQALSNQLVLYELYGVK